MKTVPYVVTEDIRTILSRYGDCRINDIIAEHISKSIISHCEKFVNDNVVILSEKELTDWVTKVATSNIVIQTLAYTDGITSKHSLHITRAVNEQLDNIGLRPRQGYLAIEIQLKNLGLFKNHTILEDVIYSGKGCKETIEIGKENNVYFDKIIACVTIGKGKQILESLGIDVISLHHFDSVVDEICQRDFIPGFPYSGRTLITHTEQYRYVPYLLPWGNPTDWATVPKENAVNFSKACIATAIEFWEEVNPGILFSKVPAVIYDPKVSYPSELKFIDYLHQCYKAL